MYTCGNTRSNATCNTSTNLLLRPGSCRSNTSRLLLLPHMLLGLSFLHGVRGAPHCSPRRRRGKHLSRRGASWPCLGVCSRALLPRGTPSHGGSRSMPKTCVITHSTCWVRHLASWRHANMVLSWVARLLGVLLWVARWSLCSTRHVL